MKRIFFLTLLCLFLFIFPQGVYASSNFLTNYDVTYTIYENQNSNVRINVNLTNTSDVYYASSYKIQVGFEEIKNIKAFDSSGSIVPTVVVNGKDKIINLEFNDRIVGAGNKLNFTLSFDTSNIANKSGKIWEINIPGLSKQEDFDSFRVHVVTPKSFGNPSFVKPILANKPVRKQGSFDFEKEDLGKSGISMTFGDEQVYEFDLKYHLANKNIYPIKTEIALPPSTNYQDIIIDDINPKPENVTIDEDGNWLAQYMLSPSQKITAIVHGKAKVKLNPTKELLSPEQALKYLNEEKYWEVLSPKIVSIAKDLKTPQKIYNYVVGKLNYDYSRVSQEKPRLGALNALNNPTSAVCLEFTDLFIALARAAGIPAREVNGYGFTRDSKERPLSLGQDILHSWPEYYDKESQSWIMIDPTWGNTTGGIDFFNVMDFDHIAFVIKGIDSEYPVPAGGYKLENDKNSKDVNISLSENFMRNPSTFQIYENFSKNYVAGFPINGELTIKNLGSAISENNQLIIESGFLTPSRQRIVFEKIPPFGYTTVKVKFDKTSFLTNRQEHIKITIGGTTLSYKINLSPFFLNIFFLIGGSIIVAIFTIGISIYFIKSRNLSFFRQKE